MGLTFAQVLSDAYLAPEAQSTPALVSSVKWYGEVWDLLLDGQVLVRFPDGTTGKFPVSRLYHLDDGMDPHGDHLGPVGDDELEHEGSEGVSGDFDDDDGDMSLDGEDGWTTEDDDGAGEDVDELDTTMHEGECAPNGVGGTEDKGGAAGGGVGSRKRKRGRRESRGWADDDDEDEAEGQIGKQGAKPAPQPSAAMDSAAADNDNTATSSIETPTTTTAAPVDSQGPTLATAAAEAEGSRAAVSMPADIEDVEDWKRFEVLDEAPVDHHYANEVVQVPSKSFMSRVRKEHGVLASSLPRA